MPITEDFTKIYQSTAICDKQSRDALAYQMLGGATQGEQLKLQQLLS